MAAAMRPRPPTGALEQLLRLLPVLLGAYMVIGAAAGRSELRVVLGRYSPWLAAMLAACASIYAIWAVARARGGVRVEQVCLLGLVAASYLLPASQHVRDLAAIGFVLSTLRLSAGIAVCLLERRIARMHDRRPGAALWLGVGLAVLACVDLALVTAARWQPLRPATETGFRVAYDLHAIADDDVVLIGDSLVWGQGVPIAQRFGDRLEALYAAAGTPRRVHSLGINDADLGVDLRTLASLPERKRNARLVLAFNADDMPPHPRLVDRVRAQLFALGTGAPSLRVLAEAAEQALAPGLGTREQRILDRYAPSNPTYARRLAQLEADVARFRFLAATRSTQAPVLLLIPLMVDFDPYPLASAHAGVRQLGERYGFKVVDLLPVFRAQLRDGHQHLAAPGDPHFDATTHSLVASALRDAL